MGGGVRTLTLDPPLEEKRTRKNRFRQRRYIKVSRNPISFRSPLLRKGGIVLDSGRTLWIPDPCQRNSDSGFQSLDGFWIP